MSTDILANEPLIRLGSFATIFLIMALCEIAAPRRRVEIPRITRWSNNLALVVIDAVLVRVAFPVLAVGMAILAGERGWGLLNALDLPVWMGFLIAFLALDFAIYLQHVLFHAVPALWRLHRMHHADLEFDLTTGVRFHPIEVMLSMGLKLGVVTALGAPAIAVLAFEVALNATAVFNHANVRIPPGIDRILSLAIVTPDMHRVHHSVIAAETNSNFGFNLPWWDRLLGTYRAQPQHGHAGMTIGLHRFRATRELWLDRMLLQPFRGPARDDQIAGLPPADPGP